MKRSSLITIAFFARGQNINSPLQKNLVFEMLFPEGKSKAFVLSEDDGPVEDRQLIQLLNKYEVKGTFHINAGRLKDSNTVNAEEIKTLYKGHEVSVHGYLHKGLGKVSRLETFFEVAEDRRALERLTGDLVRGMAYAFGSNNTDNLDILQDIGIQYARTVEETHSFDIPENFLLWHPSIHQLGGAHYTNSTTKLNEKGLAQFFKLTDEFLGLDKTGVFYVWGHSWELTDKWDVMEKFLKRISGKDDIFYATHIELVDYIHAYRNLIYSVDKSMIKNPGSTDVYLRFTDYSDVDNPIRKDLCIPAGTTVNLNCTTIKK
ncbi:polysaccharide deacetylase family protein [Marinilabilia rubra]|uniref:Polysaccharide deacetylase n=1 Tax=Marinilabilia rubra TaxID=2162893 RepID=A0A2U2BC56_9BACT|nr:polysaccharide deacetylase family protein [Marinilabilia rubra]PWE00613.1 polysaccharide deacetylase [Marinilabilia rubra]